MRAAAAAQQRLKLALGIPLVFGSTDKAWLAWCVKEVMMILLGLGSRGRAGGAVFLGLSRGAPLPIPLLAWPAGPRGPRHGRIFFGANVFLEISSCGQ